MVPKQLSTWAEHVAKVKKENPTLSLKQVLQKASKTYVKKNDNKESK
jgi:hypothetical protein